MMKQYYEGFNRFNGKLSYRGMTLNGLAIGYIEAHRFVQTLYIIA